VVIFEHKGLYWSKVPGTLAAKTVEPAEDYILPFGKANVVQEASQEKRSQGESMTVITYGMGVHWALNASKAFEGQVEIVDLRTLNPLDKETIFESVKRNNRCLVLTEDCLENSFARNIAGMIQEECFTSLDAPVMSMGSESMPAIPLNSTLEQTMIPNAAKVESKMRELLTF
jgi:2-oxoisovalerate dehydrogenase E1 component